MIEERRCSYEVCKLLHEKGFDVKCTDWYFENNINIWKPTHQMACDWLAEKYHLFFKVGFGNDIEGDFLYVVDIYDLTDSAVYGRYIPMVEADDYLKTNPKTVGEAIEEALKYSLENLV